MSDTEALRADHNPADNQHDHLRDPSRQHRDDGRRQRGHQDDGEEGVQASDRWRHVRRFPRA
jgi:hypothetical protein